MDGPILAPASLLGHRALAAAKQWHLTVPLHALEQQPSSSPICRCPNQYCAHYNTQAFYTFDFTTVGVYAYHVCQSYDTAMILARSGFVVVLISTNVLLMLSCTANGAFLQSTLPLEPVLATPMELLSNTTKEIDVSYRQALTVRRPSYTAGNTALHLPHHHACSSSSSAAACPHKPGSIRLTRWLAMLLNHVVLHAGGVFKARNCAWLGLWRSISPRVHGALHPLALEASNLTPSHAHFCTPP